MVTPADPRGVLAEAEQAFHRSLDTKTPCIGEEAEAAWADFVDRLAAAGVHLSVDGGPPAEPWTPTDEEGRRYRVEGITAEEGAALHHSPSWVALFPSVYAIDARPVPAGEAEKAEPTLPTTPDRDGMWLCRCSTWTMAESCGLCNTERPAASSDGPAAPTWPNGYGLDRLHPPAAPATCDGSGEVENLSPIARGEMPRPCPGCPRCTPCGRCGTVGGGGVINHPLALAPPCPDCGGTAPTGGSGS